MAEEVNVVPTPVNPVTIKGAIAFSAEQSRIWAEGTDEEVEPLGGEHSAKGWSSLAEGEAKDYTDQQLAQARSEITTQINNATSNAVDVSKAYTDSQKLPATLSYIGLVKPDGNTTTVDADGTIHAVSSGVLWGNISGNIADQTDLKEALDGKQSALTAGSNITISDNTISATDTTYSEFTGADGAAAGVAGLVPAPAAADNTKYLKGDGTWESISLPSNLYTQTNLLAGTNISITEIPQPVIDENTLGIWHFDGDNNNAVSSSSLSLSNASSFGSSNSIYKFGTAGAIYQTSGATEILNISTPMSNWTLDCWARTPASNTSGNHNFIVQHGGQVCAIILKKDIILPKNLQQTLYSVSCEPETWHHIAIESYSGYINCYVDGNLIFTETSSADPSTATFTAKINNQSSPGNCYFDEFRLSNVARYQGNNFTPFTQPYATSAGPAQYAINNTKADPDLSSYLQNTATGTDALTLLGTASTQAYSINIGKNSVVSSSSSGNQLAIGNYAKTENQFAVALGSGDSTTNRTLSASGSVAVGYATKAQAVNSVAVGCFSSAGGYGSYKTAIGNSAIAGGPNAIAIGYNAQVTQSASVENAIQIGSGTNSTANTFQVFNTQVVNASGKIPMASTDITSLPGYNANETQVLWNMNGTLQWVTTTYQGSN